MSNSKDKEEKNQKLEIEEMNLQSERDIFKEELRTKYNKNDISHYFDIITENKKLGWENKLQESKLSIRNFSNVNDADILSEEFNEKTYKNNKR